MSSQLEVVGQVEGDPGVAVYALASMEVDGQRLQHSDSREVVIVSDGRRIVIELDHAVVAPERASGRWGELAPTLGWLFADRAPGDHVHVEIDAAVVRPGDMLAVVGDPIGEDLEAGAGYRDPTQAYVSRVRASYAGRGTNVVSARAALARVAKVSAKPASKPKRAVEPRPQIPQRLWTWFLALAGVGLTGYALSRPDRSVTSPWFIAALQFLVSAVIAWTARYHLARRYDVDRPELGLNDLGDLRKLFADERETSTGLRADALLWLTPVTTFVAVAMQEHHRPDRTAILALVCLVPVLAAIVLWANNRRVLRYLRIVTTAPALVPPIADGTWGKIDGVVKSGEPAISLTMDRSTSMSMRGKSTVVSTNFKVKFEAAQCLDLDVAGRAALVYTHRALVVGEPRWIHAYFVRGNSFERAAFSVAAGDRVTVLGHAHFVDGVLRLTAAGPESLFIVCTDPARIRAAIRRPILACAAVIAIVATLYAV